MFHWLQVLAEPELGGVPGVPGAGGPTVPGHPGRPPGHPPRPSGVLTSGRTRPLLHALQQSTVSMRRMTD